MQTKETTSLKLYLGARKTLERLIKDVPDFITQWPVIEDTFKALNFLPYDDNKKKVQDYRWINHCFSQFVFIKQKKLLASLDDPMTLVNLINQFAETRLQPKEEGWSVRYVVYVVLRNAWLRELSKQVNIMLANYTNVSKTRSEE